MVYARQKHLLKVVDEHECLLLQLLDEEYTRHPFYGSRRMTAYLCKLGQAGSVLDANVRLGRYGAWSQYQ